MSRHRKIDVRMWGDAKFSSLSAPQPNGQTLWVYLLTGPHTTSIPGLFTAGESALAEALGWPLKGFREALNEALEKGMLRVDKKRRVVWIPNAILYNRPESINVVKSWRAYWDEIPECELKSQAHSHLKGFLEGMGKGFGDAFSSSCLLYQSIGTTNQEQEQEQEQEQNTPPNPPKGEFEEFWQAFPSFRKQGKQAAQKSWARAIKRGASAEAIIAAAREYAESPVGRSEFVKGPVPWLNQGCWEDDRAAWHRGPNGQGMFDTISQWERQG